MLVLMVCTHVTLDIIYLDLTGHLVHLVEDGMDKMENAIEVINQILVFPFSSSSQHF